MTDPNSDAEPPRAVEPPPVAQHHRGIANAAAERRTAWERDVAPVAAAILRHLPEVGGPDEKHLREFHDHLAGISRYDSRAAMRLLDEYVGRFLMPAAVAAGIPLDEVGRHTDSRRGER